jgi:pyridoxamine 5'-phosphate oxidase
MLFTSDQSFTEIWENLIHELHRGVLEPNHPFRFVNLGTFANSFPEIRSVVLRKIDAEFICFVFTDLRSAKVTEIQSNPAVSLHFYHPTKRVQLRIHAQAEIHIQNKIAASFWKQVQGEGQKAYNSSLKPGAPIQRPEQAFAWPEEMDSRFFAVLQLTPESIEALQLDGLKHLRVSYSKKKGNWEGEWLAP